MNVKTKIGYFMLALVPILSALIWTVLVSNIGFMIYAAAETGMNMAELMQQEQLLSKYQTSVAYEIVLLIVYLGFLLYMIWYFKMFGKDERVGMGKQILKPYRLLLVILCGIVIQIGVDMALILLFAQFPTLEDQYAVVMNVLNNDSVIILICTGILAPIGEEMIFRGLTFRILQKGVSWQVALVIQALVFGVYHANLIQGIYAALFGLVLGYLAYRYQSVLPSILLHMAINISSYFADALFPDKVYESTAAMIMIGIAAGVLGAGFYYILVRGSNPAKSSLPSAENNGETE